LQKYNKQLSNSWRNPV